MHCMYSRGLKKTSWMPFPTRSTIMESLCFEIISIVYILLAVSFTLIKTQRCRWSAQVCMLTWALPILQRNHVISMWQWIFPSLPFFTNAIFVAVWQKSLAVRAMTEAATYTIDVIDWTEIDWFRFEVLLEYTSFTVTTKPAQTCCCYYQWQRYFYNSLLMMPIFNFNWMELFLAPVS